MHLSKFQDPSRIEAFREFCNLTVPVVNPAVVIASGKNQSLKLCKCRKSRYCCKTLCQCQSPIKLIEE